MAIKTKTEYSDLYLTTSGLWPDNVSGEISPADLRAGLLDLLDTTYEMPSGIYGSVLNGNYSQFDQNGFTSSHGSGMAWEDVRIPGSLAGTGASAPDLITLVGGGLRGFGFDGANTSEQVFFQIQLPHSWCTGTDIHPHVHWTPTTAGAGNICWFLEYTWTDINGTFSSPVIISGIQAAAGQWKHQLCDLGDISGSGITGVSSMLLCRLYRLPTSSLDSYGDDAGFLEFDIHYQIDTAGSRQETSK